jgi:hypothetical protein
LQSIRYLEQKLFDLKPPLTLDPDYIQYMKVRVHFLRRKGKKKRREGREKGNPAKREPSPFTFSWK